MNRIHLSETDRNSIRNNYLNAIKNSEFKSLIDGLDVSDEVKEFNTSKFQTSLLQLGCNYTLEIKFASL